MIRKDLPAFGVCGVLLLAAVAGVEGSVPAPHTCGGYWSQGPNVGSGVRSYFAMAHDGNRGRTVIFGAIGTPPLNETWEYDGTYWSLVNPVVKPPGRWASAMTYDSTRRRIVLFAGEGQAYDLGDTWAYDGVTWTQLSSTGPPPRDGHGLAYDSARDRVVLFGGAKEGSPFFRDTWEFDGTQWLPGPPAPAQLTARNDYAICHDATRGLTVLFGGRDVYGLNRNDTWEYDGTAWVLGPTAPAALSTRAGPGMSYDATRRLAVLFGGWHIVGPPLDDTWEYDGLAWRPGPAAPPGMNARYLFGIVHDAAREVTVICGGNGAPDDTWELAGSLNVYPPALPDGIVGTAYSQQLMALGGSSPATFSVSSGSLPSGLSLSPSGLVAGTPATGGLFPFDVTVSDGTNCTGTRHYDLVIHPQGCSVIVISPAALPLATMGYPYAATIQASGGYPPYTWSVGAGVFPPGLLLSTSGAISGDPTASGLYAFDVVATDAVGCIGTKSYVVAVRLAIDVVSGEGHGPSNGNGVIVHRSDGTATGVAFFAYGGQWGTNVAPAQIGATSIAEILTGPGPGPVYGPQVRAWNRNGSNVSGVNFFAYGTPRFGVNVAGGRLDADVFDEILTGPGPGAVFGPHVRGFNYDGAVLTAMAKVSFFAYGTLQWGGNVASGSVDSDGYDEIVTGPGPGPSFLPHVRGFDYDGVSLTAIGKLSFQAYAAVGYGVGAALGDVDGDAIDEIATAPGAGPGFPARFLGFNYDGASVSALAGFDVTAYATSYGGRPSVGDVTSGLTARDELVTGAGPDPAASSLVRMFDYRGSLSPLPTTIVPFSGPYGVDVSCGALGW